MSVVSEIAVLILVDRVFSRVTRLRDQRRLPQFLFVIIVGLVAFNLA